MRDVYGVGTVLSTNEQTLPEGEESSLYAENTTDTPDTGKVFVNKNMIWGAVLLLVAVMVAVHFID